MTTRADIVALLTEWDGDVQAMVERHARRQDGRPFTEAELDLLGQAGIAELEAAARVGDAIADYHETAANDYRRLGELLEPMFAKLPDGTLVDDAIALLAGDQKAEVLAIIERLAPDGTIVVPNRGGSS